MSENSKRTAEIAFDGESTQPQSKRKRVRNKEKQSKPVDNASNQSSKPETTDAKPVEANRSLDESAEVSKQIKLEDRITAPNSTPSQLFDRVQPSSKLDKSKSKRKRIASQKELQSMIYTGKKQGDRSNSWGITTARGGIFIDQDPVLTSDGKYIILPTRDHVNIYSVSTSLLVRSVTIKEKDQITCCSITNSVPNAVIVGTRKGNLAKVDLSTGAILGRWRVKPSASGITCLSSGSVKDAVLVTVPIEGQTDQLVLLNLDTREVEPQILLQSQRLQNRIFSSPDSSTVAVASSREIHIGVQESEDILQYNWYRVPVPGTISSFDIRARKQTTSKSKKVVSTDLVVGLEGGAIFLYEDVASKLAKNAKSGQTGDLNPRKLHWHRTVVRSVKWSRDGNYIISGGDETVLVIWQLETNQQQFLPHLSTSIRNITVSSTGAHYGLRLGDNSVMVLATADLLPSTNITSLLMHSERNKKFPALLHPTRSHQLLAAVPIRSSGKYQNISATHLQTYDIETDLQTDRQALTRNVTTAVNISPNGKSIREPDVTHLQISTDGQWLATIDVWTPSTSDTQAQYLREDGASQKNGSETILRFWNWSSDENNWELTNRVDEPHGSENSSILALASNPVATEFSTLGADGYVKIWQPRRRVRDGVQVRSKTGQPLFTWTCARSILVSSTKHNHPPSGVLSYTDDGSILAASWSSQQRQVHLIDTAAGTVCMSLPDLLAEGHAVLATSGRYLLCLSIGFKVFDTITLQTIYTMSVNPNQDKFLSVNPRANVFAIGVNPLDKTAPGSVSIFDIDNLDQGSVSDFEIPGRIHSLLAEPTSRGFVIIDNEARSRKLIAPGSTASNPLTPSNTSEDRLLDISKSLGGIFGSEQGVPIRAKEQKTIESADPSRGLSSLFTATSTATQPGVSELFDRISKAISGVQLRVSV